MQQVFGQIFICDDQQTAKTISQMRDGYVCVTREGDKYEPQGTIHGGSQNQQANSLMKVQLYLEMNKQKKITDHELSKLKEEQKMLNQQETKIKGMTAEKEKLETTLYFVNHQVGGE